MKKLMIIGLGGLAGLALAACGDKDPDEKSDPPPKLGTLTIADSKTGTDNGSFELNSADVCSRNADTGRVDVVLSGTGGVLTIALKDYSSTPKAYTCKQATDNVADVNGVGGKFESCMADMKVPAKADSTLYNGYSIYRETTAVKPFAYAGACSINVTAATPTITGTVSCTDMVQTVLESAARNPIEAGVHADLTAEFKCDFR